MRALPWALVGLLFATGAWADVAVTWSPNREADLAGYVVQYAPTCDHTFTDLAVVKSPSFLDLAHIDGAYRVLAFDAVGQRSQASPCQLIASPFPPAAIVTAVQPSITGARITWTGTASGLRYASDDTTGYVDVTSVLSVQGEYVHTRTWKRTASWVCYQVEDAASGVWTEQGCNNFSGVEWDVPIEPEPPVIPDTPTPFTIVVTGERITIEYAATACPRGLNRATTGTQKRTLTLTCKK